jgi:hypothetical protein
MSSMNSLVALVSPLGRGVYTARETQVPVIANRMKISNHFASVICTQKKNVKMSYKIRIIALMNRSVHTAMSYFKFQRKQQVKKSKGHYCKVKNYFNPPRHDFEFKKR